MGRKKGSKQTRRIREIKNTAAKRKPTIDDHIFPKTCKKYEQYKFLQINIRCIE